MPAYVFPGTAYYHEPRKVANLAVDDIFFIPTDLSTPYSLQGDFPLGEGQRWGVPPESENFLYRPSVLMDNETIVYLVVLIDTATYVPPAEY